MNYVLTRRKFLKDTLTPCINNNGLLDNKDKLVVKKYNDEFHVFTCTNGRFYIEKYKLHYPDILDYVIGKDLNTYFIDCNYDRLKVIKDLSNNKVSFDDYTVPSKPSIYIKDGEDILKLNASIDKKVLLKYMDKTYNHSDKYNYMSIVELFDSFDDYHEVCYPLVCDNMNNIVLPKREDEKNELFFILNRIYSKEGKKASLSSEDILDLYKIQKKKSSKYIDDIMNSIDIEVERRLSSDDYDREPILKSLLPEDVNIKEKSKTLKKSL